MGAVDETFTQLAGALKTWDFTPAFPSAFITAGGKKSVQIVSGWPMDIIDNMQTESNNGSMTQAILSLFIHGDDEIRALGDHFGPGAGQLQRFGTRWSFVAVTTCWADQQMGGADTVTKLAGQVYGCYFFNRTRLTVVKLTRVASTSREAYQEREQLWRYDLTAEGYAVVSYDA